MLLKRFLVFFALWFPLCLCATEEADTLSASQKARREPLPAGKSNEDVKPASYKPEVYGAVKARFEVDTELGDFRFSVRNSRLGVRGLLGPRTRYTVQVDLNSEGKISVLDSYVAYFLPQFEIIVGQQRYWFSTDLYRGSSSGYFVNRSFIAEFLTAYSGSSLSGPIADYVRTMGPRDIGAQATYDFSKWFPVRVGFGLFNGSGANNPEWTRSLNIVARIEAGRRSGGLGAAAAIYAGHTPVRTRVLLADLLDPDSEPSEIPFRQKLLMWNGEIFYIGKDFLVEAEVAQRIVTGEGRYAAGSSDPKRTLTAAHVHGFYRFVLPKNALCEHIAPIARWDMGSGIDFLNLATRQYDAFDAQRATVGVTFGLAPLGVRSEFRINYEKFFPCDEPSDFRINKVLHDKFAVEFLAIF